MQIGARHRYAIPKALHRHQILTRFLTDFVISEQALAYVDRWLPRGVRKRLRSRAIPADLARLTETSMHILWQGRNQSAQKLGRESWDQTMVRESIRACPADTTIMVGLYLEAIAAFEEMKSRGIQTVMEVYIAPHSALIVRDENKKYPQIASRRYDAMCETADQTWGRAIAATDHYIAPSQFVVEGLNYFGVDTSCVRVVPYGVPDEFFCVENKPIPKRVLFVGTADIRKGIHYFAEASSRLHHAGYEFHVVGGACDRVQKLLRENHVVYHGRIPRHQTLAEYEKADLFVLPSLAEGSATVAYESMAAGVPVITTPNAGSVITNEIDGIIVPVCDANELTKQIDRIASNRNLRDELAGEARTTAARYRLDAYGDRFVEALLELTGSGVPKNQHPEGNTAP
tara:strand:- start:84995 stop:86197 length:1203 start_codon:yes stop_codon:yes gene_type:complete